MKFFAAAMLGIVAAACTKADGLYEPAPAGEVVELSATLDGGTRVTYDALKLNWELSDKICIFVDNGYEAAEFSNISEAAGPGARFSGTPKSTAKEKYRALYPYRYNARYQYYTDEFVTDFPTTQTIPAGGVSAEHLLMTAEGLDNLAFKPRVGLLAIVPPSDGIETITLAALDGAAISSRSGYSGTTRVRADGTAAIVSGKQDYITVKAAEGAFIAGRPYHVAMLPGDIEGISICFAKSNGERAAKYSLNTLSVTAGKTKSLGDFSSLVFSSDLPGDMTLVSPFDYYNGTSDAWPYTLAVGATADLDAGTRITPASAPQEKFYVSGDPRISVSADGKATASEPVLGYVRVSSVANPSVYRQVWLNFAGVLHDGIYYNLNSKYGTAAVTNDSYGQNYSGECYGGDISIPAQITVAGTTYNVTSVGRAAFRKSASLTSVTLPEGIEYIETEVFNDCTALTSVNIPATVTSMDDGNSTFLNCPLLGISSASTRFPVDEFGNLYNSSSKRLIWFCEKTTGAVAIREGTTNIGSGSGSLYNSFATSIKFPASLTKYIWVNSFRGNFPKLEEIVVDFPSYEAFETVFKYYRKDSSESTAGKFSRIRNSSEPVKLSVPAAALSEYASAVSDYGFSEVVTH